MLQRCGCTVPTWILLPTPISLSSLASPHHRLTLACRWYLARPRVVQRNARSFGSRIAYREKEFGIWQSWTWAEAHDEIRYLAAGFLSLGVRVGDVVALAGRNRPAFYWSMIAAQYIGAIPVPVYQDSVAEEMAFVLDNCGARFAVVGDQEQVDKLLDVSEQIPSLSQIVYIDPRGLRRYDQAHVHAFSSLQELGKEKRAQYSAEIDKRVSMATGADVGVILYTSGTTGRPKGVVMTHDNLLVTARNTCQFDNLTEHENVLAYLPMAWVGDFVFSVAQGCWVGFCVNCPESAETMQKDLQEIGATYFFAPPRFFEGLLTTIKIRMEDASAIKRKLFNAAIKHARKTGPALLEGRSVSMMDKLKYKAGHMLIYGPLLNATGLTKVRVGYTAGEAIGPELFEFYRSLGINLKQLYGQTEACIFVTQQPDGQVYADTVGVPSPGVEVRIEDSGEVFYRSQGTFKEYFKNPEATAETKNSDGWVATGDAGYFDKSNGHLRIIDRAKDVGKLASGNMFAPKFVENKLKFYPEILEAVVFGRDRGFCTALINIDLNAVGNWIAIVLSLGMMILFAIIVEKPILKHLINQEPIILFMATIGLAYFMEGLGELMWGSEIKRLDIGIPQGGNAFIESLTAGLGGENFYGFYIDTLDIYAAAISILLVISLIIFSQYTKKIRALRAVADDHQAAL